MQLVFKFQTPKNTQTLKLQSIQKQPHPDPISALRFRFVFGLLKVRSSEMYFHFLTQEGEFFGAEQLEQLHVLFGGLGWQF